MPADDAATMRLRVPSLRIPTLAAVWEAISIGSSGRSLSSWMMMFGRKSSTALVSWGRS